MYTPNNSSIKNKIALSKLKRKILSHVKLVRAVILIFILVISFILGMFIYRGVSKSIIGTSVGLARNFLLPSKNRILTDNGRINVLIMGKGGENHDAPDLTDTMILASISTINKKMILISIPRDVWVPDLKDKINSGYIYGKAKGDSKTGIILAKSTAEQILGTKINYGVVIDFNVFKKIIDTVGGINVDVKNGFTDRQYPIAGKEDDNCNGDKTFACRYEVVTFKEGFQVMDGETALKFVRSRHAVGSEGNDIAREARQQLVIAAIVKKALTPEIFTNLSIDKKLINIITVNIETDLKVSEEATLARYLVDARSNIKSYTIPDNLLYNPPNQYKYANSLYTHAFVFIPANKDGKWIDVQNWVTSILP